MAERLTPGVYVEEVGGNVRPIQGVGTSTAAFIGEAARGIPDRAEFVSGFRDFERRFGGHRRGEAGFLTAAVEAFFAAGGRRAFVVRVLPTDATPGASAEVPARAADVWGVNRPSLRFDARGNGAWSDHLRLHVEPSTSFTDRAYRLRIEWTEGGRSRTVETFDNLRTDPESEDYGPRVIEENSQYLRATDLFQRDLDAAERTAPPLPEQVPALVSREPTVEAGHPIPVGARLTFSWRDGSSGQGTDVANPPAVTFSEAAVEDAGGTVAAGRGTLTPAQLRAVLGDALGEEFRVTRPDDGDPGDDIVRIEPAVASDAYLAVRLPDDDTEFDVSGLTAVRITAADAEGENPEAVEVDLPDNTTALSPAALAELIAAAMADDNPYGLAVDAAGPFVVITAPAAADGVGLAIAAVGGNAPWPEPDVIAGDPGVLVDSLRGVEITVSETIQPGVARALSGLFGSVRSAGLVENDPGDPILRPALTEDTPLRLVGGVAAVREVGVAQYAGGVTDAGRTGLHAFDTVEVNLLVMPGRNSPDLLSAAMAYCDAEDVFLLADGVGSVDTDFEISADEVRQLVEGLPGRSDNAAMYYPWITVPDPVSAGRNPRRLVPPSGHVAGVFARTDSTRGVWKAPAGVEAIVSGAVDLQHRLVDADQDLLNPIGLNCIRQFPGAGIVTWGSRTLSSDPQWRYVPVRRTALFLKESLRRGLQWAVFEPNDVDLWDRIRINISAFMLGLFRQRAFQGATPEEAFAVKCDRETNPQEQVDAGIVTAQVAFAPLKPAEFVVIQISQKSLLVV
ncbi:phage tail sheath family protein [Cryptosporangium minutisporangium]|uniref:Phage tail sheath protein n=1 Tax=Cryptosporangium minutisporangium TaxID=113569 RepID=A0ABP6T0E5_9ACTN